MARSCVRALAVTTARMPDEFYDLTAHPSSRSVPVADGPGSHAGWSTE